MIVELAAHRGATVIATASPSSAERVKALGAAVVLDYPLTRAAEGLARANKGAGGAAVVLEP
jgi:NADPH:quinone reductase